MTPSAAISGIVTRRHGLGDRQMTNNNHSDDLLNQMMNHCGKPAGHPTQDLCNNGDLLDQTMDSCGKPAGHPTQDLGNHAAVSAYGLAVAAGFRGTLREWLESLRGEAGPPGPPGGAVIYIIDEPDEHGGTIRHINGVDISNDTVTKETLGLGVTAHDHLGRPIVGEASFGVKMWFGTRAEYNALETIDPDTCYCIEEGT